MPGVHTKTMTSCQEPMGKIPLTFRFFTYYNRSAITEVLLNSKDFLFLYGNPSVNNENTITLTEAARHEKNKLLFRSTIPQVGKSNSVNQNANKRSGSIKGIR